MSVWLFDLGNSRLKYARWHDGGVGRNAFVEHDGTTLAPGWEAQLPASFDKACIASVAAPALTQVLRKTLAPRCDNIAMARTLPACAGVRIAYPQPERLGVDRFLALLAARARAPGPVLLVAVGTALTIDLLDGEGLHRGGRIAPTPALMRAALHTRVPQLPLKGGDYAEFADDTADALASGCEGAALGLIQRSGDAARALLGTDVSLLLHGGGAEGLLAPLRQTLLQSDPLQQIVLAPALVLEGLGQWAHCMAAR